MILTGGVVWPGGAVAAVRGVMIPMMLVSAALVAALSSGLESSPWSNPVRTAALTAERVGKVPTVGPRRAIRCPRDSVLLRPGQDLQRAIDARREGAVFCLRAGVYRLQDPLLPKSRDVFVGQHGAILKGSKIVANWVQEGGLWVATGQSQEGEVVPGVPCETGIECNRPEGVFIDGRPLLQVTSLSDVRNGKFFFDYTNDRIYIANDPTGHRVEASIASGAFRSTSTFARGVVIRNLVIEQFANPSRTGAIWTSIGPGWRVISSEVAFNHGIGISHHDGAVIRGNDIHHNGQVGLGGYRSRDVLVARNEIASNAIGGFAGWEAGGAKYVGTVGLRVIGNYVHNNQHHGLWTDSGNQRTVFAGNRIVRNAGFGIFHEAAGSCVIRDNVIAGNREGGVFISASSDVEMYDNVLVANDGFGVHLWTDGQRNDLADNLIHDNVIKMREGTFTGITVAGEVPDPTPYFTSKRNRFRDNMYFVSRLTGRYWAGQSGLVTWRQWRASGQDRGGGLRRL